MTDKSPSSGSEPRKLGRRLKLHFVGEEVPVFERIEFIPKTGEEPLFRARGHLINDLTWTRVTQALAVLFVEYALWAQQENPGDFHFVGSCKNSLAASLGDAIYSTGFLHEIFVEKFGKRSPESIVRFLFDGDNVAGKSKDGRNRRIAIKGTYLPPDCVEVFWDVVGAKPLLRSGELWRLANRIRGIVGLEPLPRLSSSEPQKEQVAPTPPQHLDIPKLVAEIAKELPKPPPPPAAGWSATDVERVLNSVRGIIEAVPGDSKKEQAPEQARSTETAAPEEPSVDTLAEPPPLPIDPTLFRIYFVRDRWSDETALLQFGSESAIDEWTIGDACEGVLILGTTGSGKTSGSGATLAQAYLNAGFGGLVLSAKEGEAEYWRKLCALTGRSEDLIVVTADGKWKCNLLAYEAQRPDQPPGHSENLVYFFRTVLHLIKRSQPEGGTNERFWIDVTDMLMRNVFLVFQLAGRPLSVEGIVRFVVEAPTLSKKAGTAFTELMQAAKQRIRSKDDRLDFDRTSDYWNRQFAAVIPEKTRGSVLISFLSMADIFRSRLIRNLLCSETTLTPEMILSGKIVVLDFPIKDYLQLGSIIQGAFKYFFQLAVETRPEAPNHQRPVFLWQDEAQYFYSDYDAKFQQTARSYRVSTVVLSQNLSNFYEVFGERGKDIVNSSFGNLNTQIFHANSDIVTNEWAAKRFGTEVQTYWNTSISNRAPRLGDAFREQVPQYSTSSSQVREFIVHPHEFADLKTGGRESNYEVEAYVYQTARKWSSTDCPILKTLFVQNPQLKT